MSQIFTYSKINQESHIYQYPSAPLYYHDLPYQIQNQFNQPANYQSYEMNDDYGYCNNEEEEQQQQNYLPFQQYYYSKEDSFQPLFNPCCEHSPKEDNDPFSLETEKIDSFQADHQSQASSSTLGGFPQTNEQGEQFKIQKASIIKLPQQYKLLAAQKALRQRKRVQEKAKQSISKNNIRNFLTPIVRMKPGFFEKEILEKEGISLIEYDTFLKEYFYHVRSSKLNIRQSIFDELLKLEFDSMLKQKKVFATIVANTISEQFIHLIQEKGSTLSDHQFKQQFEWINSINDIVISFLNFVECNKFQSSSEVEDFEKSSLSLEQMESCYC